MSPDEFQKEFGPEFPATPVDPHPYGIHPGHVKTGLTPRGKAALTIAGIALTATVAVGWQINASNTAESQAKAQELALKQQELRLKELQILGEQAAANQKTQTAQASAAQAKVDACVKANKTLVGKQLGATYRTVLEDCQAQYNATAGADMQAAASITDTPGASSGGGGVNPIVLAGGAGFAVLAVYGARKARRNPA
ncbi:hypothetical protein [Streptomyces longwoodensis]|uniref:hypothetical protein n=1 Tax=Streptomyces longwoodensis TaxID=68231 RepID=UPI00225A9018|nr:hypothetical protein [Streptomyces longwoodensis]MCX5001007.1 hypothetical protein [Streptomyces longwoodensis]